MSDETRETCSTCGQAMPDPHTGAEITTLREAAGVDIKTLAEHLGDVTPRALKKIEGGTGYVPGLYARCQSALRSIVSSRAAALGLELVEE